MILTFTEKMVKDILGGRSTEVIPLPEVVETEQNSLGVICIVEDDQQLLSALCDLLRSKGFTVEGFTFPRSALVALRECQFDILLTDMMLPEMNGIQLLKNAIKIDPNIVSIIMTGQASITTAVEAMRGGAFDYLLKPFSPSTLLACLTRAMDVRRLRLENMQLRESVSLWELVHTITKTLDLNELLGRLAEAAMKECNADDVSIMLPTEDGNGLYIALATGTHAKEHIGQRIHLNEGVAGWVANSREIALLSKQVNDRRFTPIHPRDDVVCAVSMPMIAGGRLVGVLNVAATKQRKPFTRGEVKALRIIAATAASALESAMLFDQVKEAEARYRAIFENAAEGLCQVDPNGRIITANPAMSSILGYASVEEMLTSNATFDTDIHIDKEEFLKVKDKLLKEGEFRGIHLRARTRDGRDIWLSESWRAIKNANEVITHYEAVIEDITVRKKAEENLRLSHERLQKTFAQTVSALARTLEKRDPYTVGHQERVASLACAIARKLGLSAERVEGIRIAGLLHDIGKISVPSEILNRPGKLTDLEFALVKQHAQAGYDILRSIDFPWPVAEIVLQHHERLDGSGYPKGIFGDQIIFEARVLGVADVVESMACHRPSRPALGIPRAIAEITKNKGVLYDPAVVEACVQILKSGEFAFDFGKDQWRELLD